MFRRIRVLPGSHSVSCPRRSARGQNASALSNAVRLVILKTEARLYKSYTSLQGTEVQYFSFNIIHHCAALCSRHRAAYNRRWTRTSVQKLSCAWLRQTNPDDVMQCKSKTRPILSGAAGGPVPRRPRTGLLAYPIFTRGLFVWVFRFFTKAWSLPPPSAPTHPRFARLTRPQDIVICSCSPFTFRSRNILHAEQI